MVSTASRPRDRSAAPTRGCRVVIFTGQPERNLLQRGRDAGCSGYLLKEAPHSTIVRAIERVSSGDEFIDPALAPALAPPSATRC